MYKYIQLVLCVTVYYTLSLGAPSVHVSRSRFVDTVRKSLVFRLQTCLRK